jgi:hypothetical protein
MNVHADEEALDFFQSNSTRFSEGDPTMIGEMPSRRTRLTVIKQPPGVTWFYQLAANQPFSFMAHWLGKRSYLCPGSDCPACAQHIGAKWIGVVLVYTLDDNKRVRGRGLLELTESAWHALDDAAAGSGWPLAEGTQFGLSRPSKRRSLKVEYFGKVNVIRRPEDVDPQRVLTDAVATLYGLPSLAPGEEISSWADRSVDTARSLIKRALGSLLD